MSDWSTTSQMQTPKKQESISIAIPKN